MKTIPAQKIPSHRLLIRASLASVLLLLASSRMASATTYTWNNILGGNWNLSGNWSPNGVPGGGDTADISDSGTYTVTVSDTEAVGTLTIGGTSGAQTLNITSGTLTINNPGTGNANAVVDVTGGTLAGTGSLKLAGPLNWSSGTISLGMQFSGGSFSASDLSLDGGMLTNNGVLYWTNNATMLDGNGSVFTNLPGATIIVSNCNYWVEQQYAGSHVFGNGGTLDLNGPSAQTQTMYYENFVNSGTVNVNSGTFELYYGTNLDSGPVNVASGATLNLGGADTFTPASSLGGAGNLVVSDGGIVALNGGLGLTGNWTFSGGAATITGSDSVIFNTITVSGGTVSFDGSGTIDPGILAVSGGTLAGPQNLLAGNLDWSGGTITNTGVFFSGGSFSSGDLFLDGATLTNNGVLYWTNNATMLDGNGSVFTNVPNATIIVSNCNYWVEQQYTGSHVFGNGGTLDLIGPGAQIQLMYYENFFNSGTVNVTSGTFELYYGTNLDSGPVNVASGATLNLGGADTFTPASSLSGAGNLVVSGGTVALNSGLGLTGNWTFSAGAATITGSDSVGFNTIAVSGGTVSFDGTGPIAPDLLVISQGTLAGPQDLLAGNLDWSGGTITNTGVWFSGGSFSSGDLFLDGATLTNNGVLYWTNNATMLDGNGSVFTNLPNATIIVSNCNYWVEQQYTGSHVFGNGGTLVLNGPSAQTQTMYYENFVNSGTVTVNSGTFELYQGTNYLANGTLNFGISNLTSFGSISFSGPADLSGTLTATILNPAFVPAANDQWQVMTYSSLAGAFSQISLPPIGDWQTIADPSSYTIEITQTAPAPFFEHNLAATNYALAGALAVLSVEMGGTQPFTNQWYSEAGGVTNALHAGDRDGRVGSTISYLNSSNALMTLDFTNAQTNDDGPYQVFVTNGFAPYSDVSAVGQLVVELEPLFNGNGSLWTLNGGATIQNNVLTLTDGQSDEARSAFFNVPMYYQAFHVAFTYQSAQGTTSTKGDGITFCLQNSAAEVGAIGTGGGSLGYSGITNSMAIAIDQFDFKGYEYVTNGQDPATLGKSVQTAPAVDPSSGDPINVSIVYEANAISLCLTDAVTLGTFVTNFVVGPPPINGGLAYIGFTGGSGDLDSVQTITNFSYIPLPPISVARSGVNVLLSWPTGIGGYQLESTTNLSTGNWVIIPGPYTATGLQYQLVITPAGDAFYRLLLPGN